VPFDLICGSGGSRCTEKASEDEEIVVQITNKKSGTGLMNTEEVKGDLEVGSSFSSGVVIVVQLYYVLLAERAFNAIEIRYKLCVARGGFML
jgi:hypothetical protein